MKYIVVIGDGMADYPAPFSLKKKNAPEKENRFYLMRK